ncbi:hypothetical protein LFT45_21090 [Arthrobacter sp. FW305-BF8]|uniref:hypothetical protein n=1 Tax=Arthrobacter sp. FW305-BF8 TaxID=2879617 RepID=UPI001F19CB6B|nr:hypothetical protein [Arthrobacter sp. FW305-BF8]UKA54164.1 hypothetical protein LFT45_21090 [Arthrobacter sp. FW305-BF8]
MVSTPHFLSAQRLAPRHRGPSPASRRRGIAAATAVLLAATGAGASLAATQVTQTNTNKLTAVGPVNTEYGFPSWYEDSNKTRVELCLDAENPLCGFLPGDIPDETAPISFPGNFPEEAFYMLSGSELTLPGGGKAVLVLGLEAAFANTVTEGDQVVFGRQRIVVKGAPANTTLTFQHPYGTITIDTDGSGDGKLVEDISPAAGNFSTALKSNIGPFLKWDPATAPAAPEGYLGDPAQDHTVTGSPTGYNKFSVNGGGLALETDQFTVQGKISTNQGVNTDSAVLNGNMIDVFASSGNGAQLQIDGQAGTFETTPMLSDPDTGRYYARVQFTGTAPTSVKVTNIGDKPASSSQINVTKPSGLMITKAIYDGTNLTVGATSTAGYPLTVTGLGTMEASATGTGAEKSWPVKAPPATVTVKTPEGGTATLPVTISGGAATPVGLDPVAPAPDPGPVVDTGTGPVAGETQPAAAVAAAASTAITPGGTVQLDGSTSTGAASYKWLQTGGPKVAVSGDTTAKPTITLPFYAKNTDTAPLAASTNGPVVMQLIVTDTNGIGSAPATVNLTVQPDTVAVAGSRHRLGTELRVTGTSTLAGNTAVLAPATTVVIYDTTPGRAATKIGTAQVDTLGAWSYRAKPGPNRQITSVLVQSSRGGTATGVLATR